MKSLSRSSFSPLYSPLFKLPFSLPLDFNLLLVLQDCQAPPNEVAKKKPGVGGLGGAKKSTRTISDIQHSVETRQTAQKQEVATLDGLSKQVEEVSLSSPSARTSGGSGPRDERLGMGRLGGSFGGPRTNISHTVSSNATTVDQDSPVVSSKPSPYGRQKEPDLDEYYDTLNEFEVVDSPGLGLGRHNNRSDTNEVEEILDPKTAALRRHEQRQANNNVSDSHEMSDKYSSAKSISSDQYFNRGSDQSGPEYDTNMGKYMGASSISSDQYFGRPQNQPSTMSYSGGNINIQITTPDLTNVKANLSEGAQKLGGKLSSMYYAAQDKLESYR